MKRITEISFPADYVPVKLLSLAIGLEKSFTDIIKACPIEKDGTINILEAGTIGRLLDCRLPSIVLSLSALDAYLSYYGYAYSIEIEGESLANKTLVEHLNTDAIKKEIERLPRKNMNRHESLLQRHGADTLIKFLRSPLELLDKIFYFPLTKCLLMPNISDQTLKALIQLIDLRNEALNAGYITAECLQNNDAENNADVIKLSENTESSAVREYYDQHNFIYELLHCAPPQTVQDFIVYIHRLDKSPIHEIALLRP